MLTQEPTATCGLINGALLATDGQLEPAFSRYKGCAYAYPDCQSLRLDEASQQELRRQLHSGARRLHLTCPIPEVVKKVRQATRKQGTPKDPKVALLEIEDVPKVPSDLEAKVGYHLDTKDPTKKERVFGYRHQKTTAINQGLGLELPLGNSTCPADANEGTHFLAHRTTLAIPVLPGQLQLGNAAYDVSANYLWIRHQGGIPVIDYNPCREDRSADKDRDLQFQLP